MDVKLVKILDWGTIEVALKPTAGRPAHVVFKLKGLLITDEAGAVRALTRLLLADGMPRVLKAMSSGKDEDGNLLVTLYARHGEGNLHVNDVLVEVEVAQHVAP
jgi:hypothetical protein